MNQLYINGTNVTSDTLGLNSFKLTTALDESTKTVARTVSGFLFVTGDTYRDLSQQFFGNCDCDLKLTATFSTDICGGISIPLELTSEEIQDDPCNCRMKISLKQTSEEERCFQQLDSRTWWQDYYETAQMPKVPFTDQPSFLQVIMIYIRIALAFILAPINLLLGGISGIVSAIGSVFGADAPDINPIDDLLAIVDQWITGCGRCAPAPLIREFLQFQAAQCGLTLKSSILNNPGSTRYNSVMFCLEGGRFLSPEQKNDPAKCAEVFRANAPIETTVELMSKYEELFRAECRISNGQLCFESPNYYQNPNYETVLDLVTLCGEGVEFTYEFDQTGNYAYGEFSYAQDFIDSEGNKARTRHYRDTLEWNNPVAGVRKGKKTVDVQFGAPRFMFDCESFERDGFFDFENIIDEFRDGSESFWLNLLGLTNLGPICERDLIVSKSETSLCKILALEPNFDYNNAHTIRKLKPGATKHYVYNYPYHFDEDMPAWLGESELLNDHHKSCDPRLRKEKVVVSGLKLPCNCDLVRSVLDKKLDIKIHTHHGNAYPLAVDFVFEDDQVYIEIASMPVVCD